jgi:hypothetical protein
MLIIGYSRAPAPAAPAGGYLDELSSDTSARYSLSNDGSLAWNGALGTLDFTMGSSSWAGVLTPLIAVSASRTYRIEVDVINASSGLVADLVVRSDAGALLADLPTAQRASAGQTRTMVITGFAPGVDGIRLQPRFRGGPVPGAVLRISRFLVARE